MEAAYGFAISVAMLMTTWLMMYYLIYIRKMKLWLVSIILTVFLTVETSFFVANVVKLQNAWPFLFLVVAIIFVMYIWFRARKITNRFIEFISLDDYTQKLIGLSNDQSIPKYASHLIYLTKANFRHEIEQRIMYSIFSRNPKRADIYWFVHIDRTDEPYTMEYTVEELVNDKVIRVDFKLGFRIQPRVNVFFRKVVEELVATKELDITSRYESLGRYKLQADFKFVIIETFLSVENEFALKEGLVLNTYFSIKQLAQPDTRAFGLDTSDVVIEKIPIVISPATNIQLKRRALKVVK
jgi:KUP system potassium uptake protein